VNHALVELDVFRLEADCLALPQSERKCDHKQCPEPVILGRIKEAFGLRFSEGLALARNVRYGSVPRTGFVAIRRNLTALLNAERNTARSKSPVRGCSSATWFNCR
jgi:hypothetical protein